VLTWLWIGIVVLVISGVVLVVRQSQGRVRGKKDSPSLQPFYRTVFTLQLGDIVQYEGADWVVEGRLTFDDDGYSWFEYMLQDGDTIRWLSVEEDDRVEVTWVETVTDLEISGEPPRQLTYGGVTYQRGDSGTARMTRIGTTMNKQAQICRYVDYSGPGEQTLSIENWNGELEVNVGRRIRPSALIILPGDGRRVYDD
jgi:hypothetical protein